MSETLRPNMFHEDTREKLEADACVFVAKAWEAGRNYERRDSNTRCEDVAWSSDELIDLLNRQAAITERQGREAWRKAASGEIYQAKQEADELREKVRRQSRQLTDTQNALESRNEEIKPRWKRDTKKLQSRIDALTAERDEWKARAAEEAANAEGHRRNANNIAEECAARARALDMQLENIHNLEHERDELRRQVSELRELNDSLHSRIESAREVLS